MNPQTALMSLALTLAIGISSALPLQHDRDTDSINVMLYSLHTRRFVQVYVGGLVTAVNPQYFTHATRFDYEPRDGKIVEFKYESAESFLHFEEVNTASSDNETESSTSRFDCGNYDNEPETSASGFDCGNDADMKSSGNESISSGAASLVLLVGGRDPDKIQHYQWKEEIVVGNNFGGLYTYSVMLKDGTVCYLAFEQDGKPVKNPCLEIDELHTRAYFILFSPFF